MTYTKEQARKEIQKLVDDFRAHEATLEKAAEAQIENNFIRPLFRYLNWNTENAGLSHAHYEFKVQATNKKGLRPDYILNLDGRDVLVMDAKQVKYSMKDPRWLYQVYSYAYSTQNSKPSEKIDFAILTDFQEFIVLDCTLYAAKPEAVNNFRVIDWTYHDYVDKFDELWELFERNNVLNDSRRGEVLSPRVLENDTRAGKPRPYGLWSRYLSPQKVKANRIPPDKAFLAEMDDEKSGWRVLLAKDMKKRNPSADGELITAAVQLLIDRLVFIKALSDREVDRDYLSEIKARVTEAGLGADDAGWFKSCKDIFDELNNFYNGSIFEPRPELENVEVSNKVAQEVIRDLQTENSPYNFAVLPVEILGTIYERFLGRVVRTTEKQVKIEDKPEVRKAGGVYYTPQYIVEYIVKNTLGKLLDPQMEFEDEADSGLTAKRAKSAKEEKDLNLSVLGGLRGSKKELTPADVAKLKILDPACGSGSFLLGAYNALIRWHKDYFARAGKEKRDRESFYRDESGQIRLTAKLKREILKNNIFGVDIDPQAVEVTRFSLSLKALEDLREGELTEERTLFHQTVLPDLSQNIKNGNSLIGTDYFGLFQPNTEELKDVKPFDWNSEFREIMEDGGFDCVIGNPPYLRIQGLQENYGNQIDYFSSQYKSAVKRFDFYLLFTEKGYQLLKSNGRLGYICPHKFVNSDFGSGLREFLVEKSAIDSLVSFGNNLVFEQATTYTGILTLAKTPKQAFRYYEFPDMKVPGIPDTLFTLTPTQFTEYEYLGLSSSPWVLTHTRSKSLLDKFRSLPRLEDVCRKIFQGVVTGVDDIYFLERGHEHVGRKEISVFSPRSGEQITIEKDILKPILKGEDVSRYSQPNYHNYCIYPYELVNGKTVILEEDELASKYPKAYQYLSKFKDELKQLRIKFKTNPKYWYSCHRARSMADFEERRIITPEISLGCNMTISSGDLYHNTKVYSVVLNDTQQENQYYWLGVLNSKIMWWFLSNTGYVLRGGYFVFKTNYLAPFPIRAIDFTNPAEKTQHDKMVALVSQMLELHKSKAGAKTQSETDVYERQIRAVDGQIDSLVYELYGLTEEEIRIVEG